MTKKHHSHQSRTSAYAAALCLLTFLVSLAVGNVIGAAIAPMMFA